MSRMDYDEEGHSIVLADGAELLVYDGASEAPRWRVDVGAPLVGVGSNAIAIVSLDANGVFGTWSHETATQVRSVALGVSATALAHDFDGRCAAVHPGGVISLVGGEPRAIDVPGATAAAFASDDTLLVGTRDGALHRFDAQGAPAGTSRVPGPVHAIAWNAGGFFLVANGGSLHRLDGLDVSHVTNAPDRAPIRDVACSPRGDRVALQAGDGLAVVLAYPSRETLGHAEYGDRTISGLAFGPGAWLGVGLDRGDANKFDMSTGAVHRTEPHPGRPRNRWLLMSAFGPPRNAPATSRAPAPERRAGPDPARRAVLVDFVREQLGAQPRWVRMWSVISLVLCLFVLGILASVFFSGAARMDDIGLPLAFAGGLVLLSLGGIGCAQLELGGIDDHPLIVALRKDPPPVARLYPTTIIRRGMQSPALSFVLESRGETWIEMDDATRAEFEAWLG
ncbi:hypothetical protein [Sandaracinus amylolyticus]|uniref:WD40 repeat domain-containing protein n=1 Tax=Sandaracinus amylolyticus TaxID=927083 RepID=A0A0F6SH54_9BACT|nr:hypothetical protein [Sandaracinus amylolyticus]AKF09849.1 hypothetical protein DB32_006998 [Sandaracinus amylolyticus]